MRAAVPQRAWVPLAPVPAAHPSGNVNKEPLGEVKKHLFINIMDRNGATGVLCLNACIPEF